MKTEIQTQVRDLARNFSNEVVRPLAENLDETERFPN